MFSKALFKQSCKANGTMWGIITFAVCFMLACVMLISGGGNISQVKNSIEDTIIVKEIDASFEKRAINYYTNATDGLAYFDKHFTDGANDTLSYLTWLSNMPDKQKLIMPSVYEAAMKKWQSAKPEITTQAGKQLEQAVEEWQSKKPEMKDFTSTEAYAAAMKEWAGATPATAENAIKLAYTIAAGDLEEYVYDKALTLNPSYTRDSYEAKEMLGSVMYTLNPNGMFNESFYLKNEKQAPAEYDSLSLVNHIQTGDAKEYLNSNELELLKNRKANGEFADDAAYEKAIEDKTAELTADVSNSLLATLPQEVSDALEEIGKADLYTLIVGSIFYKLAGLLLPIIYMIMVSNNLISGQVDSGSMAYVLSTSTKRSTVVFTQAMYLIGSLLAMFGLTTATGCVCLSLVSEDIQLTYRNLILLNLGAFLVLFALSGLCFLTSCLFDRSKRSMAIGGGLSIFALVAAMLGLFGSPVIPSVVRLDSLNYFNDVTIISFFDVISIMEGTNTFIWKFIILAVMGLIGYIVGSLRFTKKDLPL